MTLARTLSYWPPNATAPCPVRIRFHLPQPHEQGWVCDVVIEGFPGELPEVTPITANEPLDALISALSGTPILLYGREGKLLRDESENLGFPYMFSEPQQDWWFTPSNVGERRRVTIRILHPKRVGDGWTVVVTRTEHQTWEHEERPIRAPTWPQALERAAAAVPGFLAEYVEEHGGGTLEEVNDPPTCQLPCR